jgi:hypothetical protein
VACMAGLRALAKEVSASLRRARSLFNRACLSFLRPIRKSPLDVPPGRPNLIGPTAAPANPRKTPGGIIPLLGAQSSRNRGGFFRNQHCDPRQRSATSAPSLCFCRNTPRTSIRSSRSSPNSKPCCERPERGPTKPSQTPAAKSSPSMRQPNAPHTSKMQDMRRPKCRTLSKPAPSRVRLSSSGGTAAIGRQRQRHGLDDPIRWIVAALVARRIERPQHAERTALEQASDLLCAFRARLARWPRLARGGTRVRHPGPHDRQSLLLP